MKKTIISTLLITLLAFTLIGCGGSEEPMSEADMAAEHNMTEEEMQEMKEAAARMNMSLEDHMKMMGEE